MAYVKYASAFAPSRLGYDPPGIIAMYLKQIQLWNFRNFESLQAEFSPNLNVLLGANGQGKTNLIESLYLLGRGSSFRPATNQSLVRDVGNNASLVRAQIMRGDRQFDVEMGISQNRKDYLVNGKKASSLALEQNFPMVLFSPESLSVIKDGPEQRRNFLDEMLASFAPHNARAMADYRHVLRTRNRVLKDHLKGRIERAECLKLLESLQDNFLDAATRLTWARLEALRALQSDFEEAMRFISHRPSVDISVDYLISEEATHDWEQDQVREALRRRLSELHFQELASGVSLVGPHKHDIRVLVDQKDSRFYCSQGQQRALILSFKMARIVYHYRVHKFYPFLLLDDVLSELDIEKRGNLVVFLKNIRSQIFITTTDFSLPADLGAESCRVFEVERGSITKTDK